jgi:hypothetical protein
MRGIAKAQLILLMMISIAGTMVCASPADAAPAPSAWPLEFDVPAGHIEIYQPQPESLQGDKLDARAAVSWMPADATEPQFGTMWFSTRLLTDRDEDHVTISQSYVRDVRLPHAGTVQEQQFAELLVQDLPRIRITFPLDQLVASLDATGEQPIAAAAAEAAQLQNNPPRIIFSTVPATLVTTDGPPKLQPIAGSNIMRVANTPFTILWSDDRHRFYLKAGDAWVGAPEIAGPWHDAIVPPEIMEAAAILSPLPVAEASPVSNAASAAATVPPSPLPFPSPRAEPRPEPRGEPEIIVATTPTELIVTDGPPVYTPLPGNELLFVSNTQSNLFLDGPHQEHYVLLSGRWFRSKALEGRWEYVPADKLPAMFARIPADSPKAEVLTFVPGTMQARDAVLDARVPQTGVIRRDAGARLKVTYDGPPEFARVEGTTATMTYATNTSDAVLFVNGAYYCCHEAVWYQAPSPSGAWTVCTSVPAEIHTIPPSSPIYNVRFVHIYDLTPTAVYCGYLPGYLGSYVSGPTVVHGTGYIYPAWDGAAHIPRPWTYGFGAYFDSRVSMWDVGLGYGWGPEWFGHDHDLIGWWGAGGYRDYGSPHNRIGDRRDVRLDRANIYNRIANVHRNVNLGGDDWRIDARVAPHNDVFAGRDGSVYRRTAAGWDQRGAEGWRRLRTVPDASAGDAGGLESDYFARQVGAVRATQFLASRP